VSVSVGKDGVPQSLSSMLSMPSGEVEEFGRRVGCLGLKRENKAMRMLLRVGLDLGSRSGAI